MSAIGRLWAGHLYGTNTGKLAATLQGDGPAVAGEIRLNDDSFGPVVFEAAGSFNGSDLQLTCKPTQHRIDVHVGIVTITASLSPEGSLRGQWTSELGTGGTFILFPHDGMVPASHPTAEPEQLNVANRAVGAIRFYGTQLSDFVKVFSRDFSNPRPVITYRHGGTEASQYYDEFFREAPALGELRYLKIHYQEPDAYGLVRSATVELDASGNNIIRTQGVSRTWVSGKLETIAQALKTYEAPLASNYRRYGITLTQMMLVIITLIAIPELEIWRRGGFILIVFAIQYTFSRIHTGAIPSAIVSLSDRPPPFLVRIGPALSWLSAFSAALAATIAAYLLTGDGT